MSINNNVPSVLMIGPSLSVKGGISSVEKLMINNNLDGVEYNFLSTTKDNNKLLKILDGIKSWFQFSILTLSRKHNLVHIHFASRGSVLRKIPLTIIAKKRHIPIILHAHGAEFKIFHDDECSPFKKKRIRNFLNRASCLIVLSQSWKKYYTSICDLPADKIYVMKNPVDVSNIKVFNNENDSNRIIMNSNGRIGHRKGSFDLLRSFKLLTPEIRSKSSFVATGDGEINKWNDYIIKNQLTDFAKTTGWISNDEFFNLRKKCSIFLLPSYDEGLPMALLESMAHGQVPIVSPVGGIPEVIENMKNGILVEPGDIKGLANAITLLVSDNDLRHELSIKARETALTLDINNYMLHIIDIYNSFLQNRHFSP